MAKVTGAEIFPVDVGVAEDLDCPGVWDRKVAYGTGDITQGPAMSRSVFAKLDAPAPMWTSVATVAKSSERG